MEGGSHFDEENPFSPIEQAHHPSLGQPSQSLPVFPVTREDSENTPLLANDGTGNDSAIGSPVYRSIQPSCSFSNTEGIHHYTQENKPKRRPFHLTPSRRISSEQDSVLYARFRYYSRLRAPADFNDDALVIPDHIVPTELFLFYIPGKFIDSDGKHKSYITIIAIWNTMMGTSLLTMPWACSQAGFVGGIVIMVAGGALCLFTAYKLLTLQRTMGLDGEMHELGYLFRTLWPGSLGKVIEGAAVTFSVVTLLGALVVYWVLMSNFLYNTGEAIYQLIYGPSEPPTNSLSFSALDSLGVVCPPNVTQANVDVVFVPVSDDAFHVFWKQDLSVPLLLIIPFAFLLNIKNTSVFTYFNSFGAISVLAIYTFVIVKGAGWGINLNLTDETNPFYVPMFEKSFMALSGTLSLAYFIHNCVITILKGNKHPENNGRDLTIAYGLVMLTYVPVGMIFLTTFPLPKFCIVDNFLDNFPPHNLALGLARCFLLFQMLTVFPLLSFFLRSQFLGYILGPGVEHTKNMILVINGVLMFISVIFAIFYPNIGFLIRWVGAISGMAYVFVLPAMADLQAYYNKGELSVTRSIGCSVLICMGVANFVAQFFIS